MSPAGGNFDEPVTQATLLSTGAFLGLSRELSDARKYPAIDRIDSNSKYPSLISEAEVRFLKELLSEGKTIASNLILMGEKGITNESYITYQKSELLDAVFLQQNSFHKVDGVTHPKRLRLMFNMIREIIETPVEINDKKDIRSHFNFIRQAFIDWNYMTMDNPKFEKQKSQILSLVKQKAHAKENV